MFRDVTKMIEIDHADWKECLFSDQEKILLKNEVFHMFEYYLIEKKLLLEQAIKDINFFSSIKERSKAENLILDKLLKLRSKHLENIPDKYVLTNLYGDVHATITTIKKLKVISYTKNKDLFTDILKRIKKEG